MGYSASASLDTQAPKTSGGRARIHDARGYIPKNAEATLAAENRHYQVVEGATDEEAFNRLFMDDIRAYNDKQALKYGRPAKDNCKGTVREVIDPETGETVRMKLGKKALDRMIPEDESGVPRYLEKVRADGRDMTTMEEMVLGIGNRVELGITDANFDAGQWYAMKERDEQTGGHEAADYVAAHRPPEHLAELEKARAALEKCREDWDEQFPNLRLLRFDIHMDEIDGHPHAHVAYVPVTYANKTGPAMQCSLGGAVREMGYNKGTTRGWDALGSMRQAQRRFVYEHGVEAGLDMTFDKGCTVTKHMNKQQLSDYEATLNKAGESLANAQQTLDEAEAVKSEAEAEAKTIKTDAETKAAAAKREAEEAAKQRDNAKRTRDLYAGEAYVVTRSDGTRERHLGTKGLKKRNEELRTQNKDLHTENEELHTENEGLLAENKRLRKANANLSAREAAVADRERRAKEQAAENAKDAARNAAREKQLREGIAALRLAQETIANPTVTIEGEDADAYTARVVERTVLATADVFMRSTSPHEDVQRERRQLGSDLYAEADMAASMGTRMRLDDGSEGTLFSLVRDRVRAFMREPMGAIARAVDALSARVRDYLAQAEAALDSSSTSDDLNDETTGKPRTAKQQGQRTTRAVTAQRLVASVETGQSLDDINSTPADDYGFGF